MSSLLTELRFAVLQHIRVPSQFFGTPAGGLLAYLMLVFMDVDIGPEWLVYLAVLGVINVGMFGVANGTALERLRGWDRLRKATPIRPWVFVVSRLLLGVIMAAPLVAALPFVGMATGVQLPWSGWLGLAVALCFGGALFSAIGLLLVYLVRPHASQTLLVYGALLLVSPIFLPEGLLPSWVEAAFGALPSKILLTMSLSVSSQLDGYPSVLLLTIVTVAFTMAAAYFFHEDESA